MINLRQRFAGVAKRLLRLCQVTLIRFVVAHLTGRAIDLPAQGQGACLGGDGKPLWRLVGAALQTDPGQGSLFGIGHVELSSHRVVPQQLGGRPLIELERHHHRGDARHGPGAGVTQVQHIVALRLLERVAAIGLLRVLQVCQTVGTTEIEQQVFSGRFDGVTGQGQGIVDLLPVTFGGTFGAGVLDEGLKGVIRLQHQFRADFPGLQGVMPGNVRCLRCSIYA
ncbi:hypothetical protein D3C71_1456780 [compost metagenome]